MLINRVVNNGFWIKVYDSQNHLISMRASSFKEVVAYNEKYIVIQERLTIDTEPGEPLQYWGLLEVYNHKFQRIASTLLSTKVVVHIAGENILVRNGNWTTTYNKNLRPVRTVPSLFS